MYHPDNLAEYCLKKSLLFDKEQYTQALTDAKNQVKDALILQIVLARSSYPYFEEPEFNNQPVQDRFKAKQENYEQSATIQSNLNSDELEIFYKSLPMKSYCTNLPQRQNIAKSELVKTQWFKSQIEKILNNGK